MSFRAAVVNGKALLQKKPYRHVAFAVGASTLTLGAGTFWRDNYKVSNDLHTRLQAGDFDGFVKKWNQHRRWHGLTNKLISSESRTGYKPLGIKAKDWNHLQYVATLNGEHKILDEITLSKVYSS